MSENQNKTESSFLSMEGIVLGALCGLGMVIWGAEAYLAHEPILKSAVAQTLGVAIYLTMLVSYCGLKIPVFFPQSARWSTFCLIVFAGHISLLFDSFAVVLLLATGVIFIDLGDGSRFNQFVVKAVAAFNALTVGGGFYLGELWGLPWFITNGQSNLVAGLPFLLAATPVCLITAYMAAKWVPVKMEATDFDSSQKLAMSEFVIGLMIIIFSHEAVFAIGVLLVYTSIRGRTIELVDKTLHELKDGAAVALGLIFLALILTLQGSAVYIQPYLEGPMMFLGAMVSSPFAGAMAPAVDSLDGFYWGLIFLALGAPMFVFSSLVAIMVFKGRLDYNDLPSWAQSTFGWIPGFKSRGHTQEAVLYTLLMIPLVLMLACSSWIMMESGAIVHFAEMLGVTMDIVSYSH